MPRWVGELLGAGAFIVVFSIVAGVIHSLWHAVFVQPREDRIKLAAEQTKKAEMELQRERLRRRRRKPKAVDDIKVVEEPHKMRRVDHDPS